MTKEQKDKTPPEKNQTRSATLPENGPHGLRSRGPMQSGRVLTDQSALADFLSAVPNARG